MCEAQGCQQCRQQSNPWIKRLLRLHDDEPREPRFPQRLIDKVLDLWHSELHFFSLREMLHLHLVTHHGFPVNAEHSARPGFTVLAYAAGVHGYYGTVTKLLAAGANANVVDHKGRNLLHLVARKLHNLSYQDVWVLEELAPHMDAGAWTARDNRGRTPVVKAAEAFNFWFHDKTDAVAWFLQHPHTNAEDAMPHALRYLTPSVFQFVMGHVAHRRRWSGLRCVWFAGAWAAAGGPPAPAE